MNQTKLYFIILTSLLIAVLHFIVNPYRFNKYLYDLKLGEIAEKDIIATFDFNVYKNEDTLKAEQDAAATKIQPIYRVSENLKFNAQKNLDFIMEHFRLFPDAASIRSKLLQNGYDLSSDAVEEMMNQDRRNQIYNYLSEELTKIFDIGIYPANYHYQNVKLVKQNRIVSYELPRLYSLEEARNKLVSRAGSEINKSIVNDLANIILIVNIVLDKEMTEVEKQRARENVPLTIGKVQKNEMIIGKNQKVTALELQKLKSLQRAQKEQHSSKEDFELILSSTGVFILANFMILVFYYIILLFYPVNFSTNSRLIIILGSFLITIILTVFVNNVLKISSLIIPYTFSVLLIAMVFSPHVGLIYNFFSLVFVSLFLNWSFFNPVVLSLATLGGLIALKTMKKKQEYYPLTLYLLISYLIVIISVSLLRYESVSVFFWQLIWGVLSITISVVGLVLATPIIERRLNMATKQLLLELLDFDNPLLKKISLIIPGTYHHSLIVGNLAETAAEAIGANHLLARVGSYYHDIGKLENPHFFIENNPDSSVLHNKMLANESAIIIKNHIQDGVALARKSRLPKPVIEIIQQHHGTSQIRYFFIKAKELNLDIDLDQFYYEGPKPQTKEAALVMIADIVESTSKSLDDFTETKIQKILDDTVENLIKEGQLDEAPLTLKELDSIKKYMLPILLGVYRKRLEYPE